MKFLKRIQKGMGLSILIIFLMSTVSYASTGDIWNGNADKGNIINLILHDKATLFDMIRHINNYGYEIDGNLYKVSDVNDEFINNPSADSNSVYSIIKSTKTSIGPASVTIISVDSIHISDTYIGIVPVLPDVVNANFSDGTTKAVKIKWSSAATDAMTYGNAGSVNISGVLEEYGNYPISATVVVNSNILDGTFNFILGQSYVVVTIPQGKTVITITVNGNDLTSGGYYINNNTATILNVKASDTIIITTNDSMKYIVKESGTPIPFISSIDDISKTINQNDAFSLPTVVLAKFSDNTTKDVDVKWNVTAIDTSIIGDTVCLGTVDGYSQQVRLIVTVVPQASISNVTPINLSTNNGVVPILPENAEITLSDGTKVNAKITWNQEALRPETYTTADASVTIFGILPDYNNYSISATVTIAGTNEQLGGKYVIAPVNSYGKALTLKDVTGIDAGSYFNLFNKYGPLSTDDTGKQLNVPINGGMVTSINALFSDISKLTVKFYSDKDSTNEINTATLGSDGTLNIK